MPGACKGNLLVDWVHLSKLVAVFLYPLNLSLLLILLSGLFYLSRRKKLGTSCVLIAITILMVSAMPPVANALIKNLESQHHPYKASVAPVADAILILGGAVALPQTPRVDLELVGASDRVRYAAKLYKEKKAKKIVIAGGNVFPQEDIRGEAYYIAQLLMEWGVPQQDILFEEQSRNTYENALYVKPLLDSSNLSRVLLVTSATHMPRAYAVFSAQNIDVIAAPTDILMANNDNPDIFNWIPTADALSNTTSAIKEYMGWYYYRLKGYL